MAIWYDFFLLLLVFSGMLLGFSMGLVRQLINILGLYFGIVFAAYFHPMVNRWAAKMLGESDGLSREAMLFFVVFFIIWLFINLGAYYSFRTAPRFLPATLDRLMGMLTGILTGLLMAVVVTLLLSYTVSVEWPQNNALRLGIQESIELSSLRPVIGSLIPTLANMIKPWLPAGLPSFFFVRS